MPAPPWGRWSGEVTGAAWDCGKAEFCPPDHPLQGVFCFLSYRFYYTVSSGKIHFERTFRDWEPGCRIVCSECRQVSSWAVSQPTQQETGAAFPFGPWVLHTWTIVVGSS